MGFSLSRITFAPGLLWRVRFEFSASNVHRTRRGDSDMDLSPVNLRYRYLDIVADKDRLARFSR